MNTPHCELYLHKRICEGRVRMLLAIDPGADCGWALFDQTTKRLIQCGLRKMPDLSKEQLGRIRALVVERPHAGQGKASKKDIITLSIRAGELAGIWSYLTGVVPQYVEPQRWGGGVHKNIKNDRVLARLFPEELIILGPKKNHNVLDAIGIGLWKIRRYP